MNRLPRRLLIWGGAAVAASAGFAFMAGNTVNASSAGDGAGVVTGYTVSHVQYLPAQYNPDGSNQPTDLLGAVSFTLTSVSGDHNADSQPSIVLVYPEDSSGFQNGPSASTVMNDAIGNRGYNWDPASFNGLINDKWGSVGQTCTSPGWSIDPNTGIGTASYVCTWPTNVDVHPNVLSATVIPTIAQVANIDVEANQ